MQKLKSFRIGIFLSSMFVSSLLHAAELPVLVPNPPDKPRLAKTSNADCTQAKILSIGGVTDFNSLLRPQSSLHLRSSCEVNLYIHANAWAKMDLTDKKSILKVFSGTGPAVVELGFNATAQSYFTHFYNPTFVEAGVKANAALVNGLCGNGIHQAEVYINEARKYGLSIVAVVFAPNSGQYRTSSFDSERWACVKDSAIYGGGIAIDSPPHFFLNSPPAYRDFVLSEVSWANNNHLRSYLIVSPNGSGEAFYSETKTMLESFSSHKVEPTQFVFETYDIARHDRANRVGAENDSGSVAGVAFKSLLLIHKLFSK